MNNKEFQIIELEKKESKEEEEKEEKKQENKPQKETTQPKRPTIKKLFKESVRSLTSSLRKRAYDNTSDFIFLFDNLSVFVKERPILRNVSLTLPKSNQIIVIAGASGCGKTTLLNVINNYDLPAPYVLSGKLNYYHSNIKMIGHKPIFNPYLTVNETVQMFIDSYRYTHPVDYYLERFRLMDIKDKYIGNDENKSLSTGQLVQLSILLNTMQTPDLLILDEPLSNLDIKTSIHIMKLLKELDIPIILTLHHPNNIILESVDQLIVMEEGEIILNTSLLEISNRLEYYEQQVLGNPQNERKTEDETKLVKREVQIVDYKEYIADVTNLRKLYNCAFNIIKYNYRNKKFNYSCLFTFLPLIIFFLLMNGTNFGDDINGYFYLINNLYGVSSSITGTMIIYLFESEKCISFVKSYSFIKILENKVFYFLYSIITFCVVFLFVIMQCICFSYLNENNALMFEYMLYVFTYAKIVEIIFFYSLMYVFENVNISNSFWGIYNIFQVLNSGIATKQYPELKNYSLFYHLMNILSVKAQEVYNYPLLPNGEPIYTLYGYSKDISNSYYYVFGFFIIPFLIYTCYNKKSKMFLT